MQTLQRTETQWGVLVDNIIDLEDVAKNQASHEKRFKSTYPALRPLPIRLIYNPSVGTFFKHHFHFIFIETVFLLK